PASALLTKRAGTHAIPFVVIPSSTTPTPTHPKTSAPPGACWPPGMCSSGRDLTISWRSAPYGMRAAGRRTGGLLNDRLRGDGRVCRGGRRGVGVLAKAALKVAQLGLPFRDRPLSFAATLVILLDHFRSM